jgi:predicted dinucleotide-binding enzyme
MRIGILGSGLMGGKLGTIFAKAGHDVVFSYARSRRMRWVDPEPTQPELS